MSGRDVATYADLIATHHALRFSRFYARALRWHLEVIGTVLWTVVSIGLFVCSGSLWAVLWTVLFAWQLRWLALPSPASPREV